MILLLLVMVMVACGWGQSRTANASLPLWNAGDVLRAGSSSDTGVTNSGINSLSLRTDKLLNKYFDLNRDSLRGVKYVRFNNGTVVDGNTSMYGMAYNGTVTLTPSSSFGLYLIPTGATPPSLAFQELPANGSNYVGFRAPASLGSNMIWTLPIQDGTANQVLKTDGNGNLGFVTLSGSGGSVTSVDKANSSLVVTPTTGAVTVKIDSTFGNIWNATQRIGFGKYGVWSNAANTYNNAVVVADSSFYFSTNSSTSGSGGTTRLKLNTDGMTTISMLPFSSNTYNLGSSTLPYKVGYLDSLHLKELKLYNGSVNYIRLLAPSLSGNTTYTFPSADGTAGYVLSTNGSGVLSWIANGSGSILPTQTGNSGKALLTDGANPYWGTPAVKIIYGGSTVQTNTAQMIDSSLMNFTRSDSSTVAFVDSNGFGHFRTLYVGASGIIDGVLKLYSTVSSGRQEIFGYNSHANTNQTFMLPDIAGAHTFMVTNGGQTISSGVWNGTAVDTTYSNGVSEVAAATPLSVTTGGKTKYLTLGTVPIAKGGTNNTSFVTGKLVTFDGTKLISTAKDTASFALAGTDSALSKGGSFYALAAVDSFIVYRVPCNGLTLSVINAIRVGGTSASINVTRTRAGSTVDLLTANYATTTSMASAGTVQNTTLQNGDYIRISARAVSGTVTELFVQLDMTRSK